jgi:uncharacterized protein YaeQ
MALTATIYNVDVELADSDRNVYESLALRLARHPSESDEYLVARLMAYLVEYAEGIEFSRGVSDPDVPAIVIRDLTGRIDTWIEVGTPDAERLHRASKAAPSGSIVPRSSSSTPWIARSSVRSRPAWSGGSR